MPSSRAPRLLGLLNDGILALPKAPSPPAEPEPELAPELAPESAPEPHLANQQAQTPTAPDGSSEPSAYVSAADQKISALAEALSLRDRSPSPAASESPESPESSHDPDPQDDQPDAGLCRGDLAPWGEAYVSIVVASRFPYRFLNRTYSDQVAKKFFDRNQFWTRDWALFYIWPPADFSSKPLILISLTQFQNLLHEINQYKRNIDFRLTDYHRDCGLILDIPHRAFTPRFLGWSSSRDDYNDMEQRRVPRANYKAPGEPALPRADKPTLEAFKAMIEETVQLQKAKSKAAKAKKKEQRLNTQQNWGRLLKRTQRYLGLRPDNSDSYNPLQDPTLNWAGLQLAQAARKLPPVHFDKPSPFPFDKNVVFISVDIEAFELDNNKITEVGVATLDVLDIIDIPPGKDAKNWFDKIRARHFRIAEHAHLENHRHVAGCAGGFEFGQSEFVPLDVTPSVVASCFKPPFSGALTPAEAQELWATGDSPNPEGDPSIVNADGKRNLIFVGHDPNQDIKYLQKLGYNPLNLSNLLEVIDTKLLHQHWKRDTQGTSLGKILADLDIIGWKLHNGGNDAVYTLQALIALGVREATSRGTKEAEEQRKQEHQKRMADAIADTVARLGDEADGWSSNEGDDGGPAPSLPRPSGTAGDTGSHVAPPGHDAPAASDCIFVGNLPYRATPDDVVAFFARYGAITDVHLPINPNSGATKGVCYVSFSSPAEARTALEKSKGVEFWSRQIRVDMAPPREKKGGGRSVGNASSSTSNVGGKSRNGGSSRGILAAAASARSQRSSRSSTPAAVPPPRHSAAATATAHSTPSLQVKWQANTAQAAAEGGEHGGPSVEAMGSSMDVPETVAAEQAIPKDWW